VRQLTQTKCSKIVNALRQKIVEGVYGPGERLPNRLEFKEHFGVSMLTVQKALNSLAADGFILARTRMGTFVADHPPHLCCYGLTIPAAYRWSRIWASTSKAARDIETGDTIRFYEYYVSRDTGREGRNSLAQLSRDVRDHCLAGLIINGYPNDLEDLPALTQPNLPRVVTDPQSELDLPRVFGDYATSFIPQAIEYLRSKGRKRIAHLWIVSENHICRRTFEPAIRQAGIETYPYWIQSVCADVLGETVPNIIHMLMRLTGDDRPDGLVVYDDNLIEHVVAGLSAAGVSVPGDLEVVAHCNYPDPTPSGMPFVRLGFDCRTMLAECLNVLQMERSGRTPPREVKVPAVFENELASVKVPIPSRSM